MFGKTENAGVVHGLYTEGEPIADTKAPAGPIADMWRTRQFEAALVNPSNRRKLDVIMVGTGLAGASGAATLGEAGVPAARLFAAGFQPVHDNARHIAFGALSFGHTVFARLSLGGLLRSPVDLGNALLGIRQIAPCRREFQLFAFAVLAPVAAIARGAE